MKLTPYLSFDGDCEAAFKFYERVLGGKIGEKMTWGESPEKMGTPAEWNSKIMHMQMTLGDCEIMGADAPPGYFQEPQGTSITISVEDAAKAEHIFSALSENGTVTMPIQKTFWATRFGMVTDQFGTPWMINCNQPSEA